MRLTSIAALVLAVSAVPAMAENELPEGVEQILVCSHVYALKSEDAREAGEEGAATEFFNMGDALLVQAQNTLLGAGYSEEQVDSIDANTALTTGFNYGAGMGEEMLASCLAAWDSP